MFKKRMLILAFCLCMLLCACTAQQTATITADEDVTVILHAGGELEGKRLLNCQEAFYHYYELGFRYFEYDLKLSSDGYLMATHSWEHLPDGYDGMAYEDFLQLDGGYTPVNEQWLMQMLQDYPDVTVIVDAKMATTTEDAAVIQRLDALQEIYHIDLSERILPEIFSVEMWQQLEGKVSFRQFLFSRYKEYYDITTVTESFPVGTFLGVALPYDYLDGYYKENIPYLQQQGYRIFMFGVNSAEDARGALLLGADTLYLDNLDMLP